MVRLCVRYSNSKGTQAGGSVNCSDAFVVNRARMSSGRAGIIS